MAASTQEAPQYRLIGRKPACSNSRFEVFFDAIETPSGTIVDDFLIVRPRIRTADGIVGVLVLPEVDGRIGLMRGYRHQFGEAIWQAPAGFVEPDEAPEQTALRELREETSLTCDADQLTPLGSVAPDAGLIEGRVAIYLARCHRLSSGTGVEHEVGTGALIFHDPDALRKLLLNERNIGAVTAVAGLRFLVATVPFPRPGESLA